MSLTNNFSVSLVDSGLRQPEVPINDAFITFDAVTGGRLSKSVAGSSNVTLSRSEALNAFFIFTGTLTGSIEVRWPASGGAARNLRVYNSTTGAFTLTLTVAGGSGVAITQGEIRDFVIDGTTVRPTNVTAGTYTQSGSQAVWARVFHNANQSIATGTPTALAFNSERADTDTIHDNATNNSRLTATTAGLYLIVGNVEWAANATGYREIYIQIGGATRIADSVVLAVSGGVVTRQTLSTIYSLTAGQYVELIANHAAGTSINVNSNANHSPEFMMVRLGGA